MEWARLSISIGRWDGKAEDRIAVVGDGWVMELYLAHLPHCVRWGWRTLLAISLILGEKNYICDMASR